MKLTGDLARGEEHALLDPQHGERSMSIARLRTRTARSGASEADRIDVHSSAGAVASAARR
jgi:hypothetical protein